MKLNFLLRKLSLLIYVSGLFAFRSSIAEPFVVPSSSMEPTILPGDRIWVSKTSYDLRIPFTQASLLRLHEPHRGEVIVFRYPRDPSIHYVKRLIGLPGDQIEIRDGKVAVNGRDEAMTYTIQRLPHPMDARVARFSVPKDQYFFLGDNRDNSNDSRFWGFVPRENIEGRALGIWASFTGTAFLSAPRWERTGLKL